MRGIGVEFLKFGVVGAIGFVVDTATVYGLRSSVGIYAAGLLAYFVAATVNWGLNRAWTFRGRGAGPAHRQWATFLAANLLGFLLNRGTFVALVALVPLCAAQPVLAVAAGAGAGMFLNFALSRNYVFRAAPATSGPP
jgi:putative flippase GtrA